MKSFARFVIGGGIAIGACVLGMQGQIAAQELPDPSALLGPAAGTNDASELVAGGLRVHIDPQTGRLTKVPSTGIPLQLSPAEANAMSTSHQGLVETLSPRPRGGAVVNLQGRFQSPLVATIDAQGKVIIQHLEPDATSAETK